MQVNKMFAVRSGGPGIGVWQTAEDYDRGLPAEVEVTIEDACNCLLACRGVPDPRPDELVKLRAMAEAARETVRGDQGNMSKFLNRVEALRSALAALEVK